MVLVVPYDGPLHRCERRFEVAGQRALRLGQGELLEGKQKRGVPVALAQDRRLSASVRARRRRQALALARHQRARSGKDLRQRQVSGVRAAVGRIAAVAYWPAPTARDACWASAHATCSRTSGGGSSARARNALTIAGSDSALPSPTAR